MVRTSFVRMFCLLACVLPLTTVAVAQPSEYEVKAAFLYQFTQFVDWPSGAFSDSNSPFVIGVLGDDPFGSRLSNLVSGKNVHGHSIIIKNSAKLSQLLSCHVLYISSSESYRLSSILDQTNGKSILTVSDMSGFAREGGMIELKNNNGKVGFAINAGKAKAAGLSISSKLLKLAIAVE